MNGEYCGILYISMKLSLIKNLILLGLSGCFILTGSVILFYIFTPLPKGEIGNIASRQSIILTDRNDEFLFDFSENEKRTYTPIEEMSENIINATIAIEDHRFFEHGGIRIDALVRAFITNLMTLSFSQGGSTITQQMVKNVFLTSDRKIKRKLKEFLLTIKIERELDKDEILELYLNTISYGGVLYGVAEASNTFFGKKPSELTVAEAAYLAAIPNAPTYFSPYGQNKKDLEERKNKVLSLMFKHELITREEYASARREGVHFRQQNRFTVQAPHFVFFIKSLLEQEYGPRLKELEGQKIKTSLDLNLQKKVEEILKEFAPGLEKKSKAKNIASVVLSTNGDILAMVGSRDFFDADIEGRVNITTSRRQTGSTFKPIAYAKAFERGLRPETVVYDVPTQFNHTCDKDRFETTESGCYSPVNYSGEFLGPISLRNALARSINIPAIKTLYIAGVAETVTLAKQMGITTLTQNPYHYGLSLVLGGADITPLEMAQAYNVFANDGLFTPNRWYYTEKEPLRKRVLPEHITREITDILSDNEARAPTFGRNSAMNIQSPTVAVKTGTTNNIRDIWIVGYSPSAVVLVWAGNADGATLEGETSGFSLSRAFRDIMLTTSETYRQNGSYFQKNTVPPKPGPAILGGYVDTDEPHSILHYIQRDNPTQEAENPEENEVQYEHWEFGVQDWIEQNPTVMADSNTNRQNSIQFNIHSPNPEEDLPYNETVTIMAVQPPTKNRQYEFYVNETLVGSSHIPIFSFTPYTLFPQKPEEITIRVIATTEIGILLAEEVYRVK